MTIIGAVSTTICFAFLSIPVIATVVWLVKLKRRFVRYTLYLRKQGTYTEWAQKKKTINILSNGSLIAFLLSMVGILATAFFPSGDLQLKIIQGAFSLFILFGLFAILSSTVLYLQVPKDWPNK
jgi:hypothetical protein